MDWPALWISVFASSGAALIGLTSAVLVFWRTRVADRRDAVESARQLRIAALHVALWTDLAPRLAWRWRPIGGAALPLARALAEVMVGELSAHPAVALWAQERLEHFSTRLRAAERGWLLPGDRRRRMRLVESVSTTVSMLMAWERGAVEEDWFASQLPRRRRRHSRDRGSPHGAAGPADRSRSIGQTHGPGEEEQHL
ncbi:hypothetical protein ACFO3K_02525 [Cellulomonas algicola]|uniref:hypothetical protein n=1 Tax=Cellulomonas algicola TaxID=2071633 RepID=UPI001C3F8304|nr:hypothetical protein [Cellulomonas algicola]